MAKHEKIEKVSKPYLQGRMVDRTLPLAALKFFGSMALMIFVYFMSMIVSSVESPFLVIVINVAILLTTWLIFWQSGLASGADAVSQGEIMYQRREKGRPVADWEQQQCYHPLKGYIAALLGALPLIICCVVFACIAKREMTSMGVLPNWVGSFESRPEIGGALSYYHQEAKMTVESILRIGVRVAIMPWISIAGAENKDTVLLLERLSPLMMLIPVVVYGTGYMLGTQERIAVHSNIALGKKRMAKKQARERRARRQAAHNGPEQLN
ncbi:MAG: hypothetical protein IJE07_06000 [Clostridia bacterium]|nr:hypothetical protein [Clostridia bacterium]